MYPEDEDKIKEFHENECGLFEGDRRNEWNYRKRLNDYINEWHYVNTIVYYNEEFLSFKEYGEESIRKTSKISEL